MRSCGVGERIQPASAHGHRRYIKIETCVGMSYYVIALFIIVKCAATRHKNGITTTFAPATEALARG